MRPSGAVAAEDSYSERRKLFRNIWETAVSMDEKEKPKLIRTLRLESDEKAKKSTARKKEKLKNLRHVCNKILDFCDKQEAEEFIFEDRVFKEAIVEDNDMEKSRRPRKTKKVRTLYTPSKIQYKHPPPPLTIGDYKHTRRQSPDKSIRSPPKFPSRKDLKSDSQITPLNDLRQSSTVAHRKVKLVRRKKVKKYKT